MAGIIGPRPRRELLYTMNGEKVYKDEIRPIAGPRNYTFAINAVISILGAIALMYGAWRFG